MTDPVTILDIIAANPLACIIGVLPGVCYLLWSVWAFWRDRRRDA